MDKEQKKLLYDIKEKVWKIEEHMHTQNGRIDKGEERIEELESSVGGISTNQKVNAATSGVWDKVKSVTIAGLATATGAMATFIWLT